jgi:hypothetical protein
MQFAKDIGLNYLLDVKVVQSLDTLVVRRGLIRDSKDTQRVDITLLCRVVPHTYA